VGEHPLDAVVLAPGFDPATATPEELARWNAIQYAIDIYSRVMGSITGHETGHALGLVEPGPPGLGLFGGSSGANYSHDVNPDGTVPSANFLMKGGPYLKFQDLAGLAGKPLPFFRPLDFAYLRDRAVIDPLVTALLPPPVATGVGPTLVVSDTWITVTGSGFAATPSLRLVSAELEYDLLFVQLVSSSQVRGFLSFSQVVGGTYDLRITNPDGQLTTAPLPIVVQH
jgi:hypothetical protein